MTYKKYSSNECYDTFIYVDVLSNSIEKEIYDLCNRIFDSNRVFSKNKKDQIEQVVDYLKIIFKDYNIRRISVRLKGKNEYTYVGIVNDNVTSFVKKKLTSFGQIEFNYDGISFHIDCGDFDFRECKEETITNLVHNSLQTIGNVNNNIELKLDISDKKLISLCKTFFGYYPDLSNEEEYNKIQSMMWLIHSQNLLSKDSLLFGDFTIRYGVRPVSFTLKTSTDKIVPYGDTTEKYTINIENICDINKISEMGKIITDYTNRYKDPTDAFANVATVSYIVDRVVPRFYEIEDIVHASHDTINEEQVEEILEFLTNLTTALQSDTPYNTYKEIEKSKVKVKK